MLLDWFALIVLICTFLLFCFYLYVVISLAVYLCCLMIGVVVTLGSLLVFMLVVAFVGLVFGLLVLVGFTWFPWVDALVDLWIMMYFTLVSVLLF